MPLKITTFVILFLMLPTLAITAEPPPQLKNFHGKGEALSVDPVFHSITIRHGTIPGLLLSGETIFELASPESLKNIHKGDLVDFDVVEDYGTLEIQNIQKMGEAVNDSNDKVLVVSRLTKQVLEKADDAARDGTENKLLPIQAANGAIVSVSEAADHTLDGVTNVYKKEKELTDHSW